MIYIPVEDYYINQAQTPIPKGTKLDITPNNDHTYQVRWDNKFTFLSKGAVRDMLGDKQFFILQFKG